MLTNRPPEQAVSTSIVYLFRSMGSVWGVAAAATIIQNVLSSRLPSALSEIPDKLKVISFLRPSPSLRFSPPPHCCKLVQLKRFSLLRETRLRKNFKLTHSKIPQDHHLNPPLHHSAQRPGPRGPRNRSHGVLRGVATRVPGVYSVGARRAVCGIFCKGAKVGS